LAEHLSFSSLTRGRISKTRIRHWPARSSHFHWISAIVAGFQRQWPDSGIG